MTSRFPDHSHQSHRHTPRTTTLGLCLTLCLMQSFATAQTTAGSLAGVATTPARPLVNQLGSKPGWPVQARIVQAERDLVDVPGWRLPVVIWHRIREKSIQATTRLWVLDSLRAGHSDVKAHPGVVTVDVEELLRIVERAP